MTSYRLFSGHDLVVTGDLLAMARTSRDLIERDDGPMPLVFDDATGSQVDIDLRGSLADVEQRYAAPPQPDEAPAAEPPKPAKRGRPRLGVVGREITLLPKHWSWLDDQRGGASATLRRLVDKARKDNEHVDRARRSQDRTNRFLSAVAGNLPGFEEATRALYAGNRQSFVAHTRDWPGDVRDTARLYAMEALGG